MNNRNDKPGCLAGFLELFALNKVSGWAQKKFGFGNGVMGCGCGCVIFIIAAVIFCYIVFGTDWTSFSFNQGLCAKDGVGYKDVMTCEKIFSYQK